jgi:hypothetical protein
VESGELKMKGRKLKSRKAEKQKVESGKWRIENEKQGGKQKAGKLKVENEGVFIFLFLVLEIRFQ